MIGWEYPPHNSGGLGVACQGLTEALTMHHKTGVHFSLPYSADHGVEHMDIHHCVHENWQKVDPETGEVLQQGYFDEKGHYVETAGAPPFFAYSPELYAGDETFIEDFSSLQNNSGYSFDLSKLHTQTNSQLERQVAEYAEVVGGVGKKQTDSFDVIHAHDWMSFPAGQELKKRTGKPLVAHVHSTEYDRAGLSKGNRFIEAVEYEGMHRADHVIAVSYYTKRLLEQKYGVDPNKISVVHNGVTDLKNTTRSWCSSLCTKAPSHCIHG